MQTFPPYKGVGWLIRTKSREMGAKLDVYSTVGRVAAESALYGQQTECMTGCIEMTHYGLAHKVVNISKNLGERLLKSKMKLSISNLRLPFHIFEVCFENGLLVPGTDFQVPSALVMAAADDATLSALEGTMRVIAKIQEDLSGQEVPVHVDRNVMKLFTCKFRDPRDNCAMKYSNGDVVNPICHANVNLDFDEGKPIEEVIEGLGELTGAPGAIPLDELDKKIQRAVLLGVMGALCYLNTADPDVSKYKFRDRPSMGKASADAILLGAKLDRMPPSWHLREAHFRTLRHSRFKRDDAGAARVVWVRTAEIKGEGPSEPDRDQIPAS
jgi:hypothetical protein